jgi:hypothetical protein
VSDLALNSTQVRIVENPNQKKYKSTRRASKTKGFVTPSNLPGSRLYYQRKSNINGGNTGPKRQNIDINMNINSRYKQDPIFSEITQPQGVPSKSTIKHFFNSSF